MNIFVYKIKCPKVYKSYKNIIILLAIKQSSETKINYRAVKPKSFLFLRQEDKL